MKALKIKVNFQTGARAGGINPRDRNLPCSPQWQNLADGYEIRCVLNGNIDPYRGVEGVEIIEGESAIDDCVQRTCVKADDDYTVYNESLMSLSITQKKIKIDDIPPELSRNTEAKILYERGALGIAKRPKPTVCKARELFEAKKESKSQSLKLRAKR